MKTSHRATGSVPVVAAETIQGARRLLCSYCGGRAFLEPSASDGVREIVCSHCARTLGQVVPPKQEVKSLERPRRGRPPKDRSWWTDVNAG